MIPRIGFVLFLTLAFAALRRTARPLAAAAAPAVAVRHITPQAGEGWAVAETANFRIYHNQSREVAEKARPASWKSAGRRIEEVVRRTGPDVGPAL